MPEQVEKLIIYVNVKDSGLDDNVTGAFLKSRTPDKSPVWTFLNIKYWLQLILQYVVFHDVNNPELFLSK